MLRRTPSTTSPRRILFIGVELADPRLAMDWDQGLSLIHLVNDTKIDDNVLESLLSEMWVAGYSPEMTFTKPRMKELLKLKADRGG